MKISTTPKLKQGKKVFAAISGGVDSAVAAALLLEKGYAVTGVFMKNWSGEEFGVEDQCPWREDQESAKAVCAHLGIPFKTFNFEKEYRESIITYFFDEYRAGRTPNPDILCNQVIKFGHFLDRALEEGADLIATGHYAGILHHGDGSCDLRRSADTEKDQTYFLYQLNQAQLSKTLFPLATLHKSEVRELAKKFKLPNAERKDSQGICFLGKIDIRDFLTNEIHPQKGPIVDADTKRKIGVHAGIWFYTLGQREGIGVGGSGEPYFVCSKDTSTNTLYVAKGKNNPLLYIKRVKVNNLHSIRLKIPENTKLQCQLRYRQEPIFCELHDLTIVLEKPAWIAAPGQSAVLLDDNTVLGGGVITSVEGIS